VPENRQGAWKYLKILEKSLNLNLANFKILHLLTILKQALVYMSPVLGNSIWFHFACLLKHLTALCPGLPRWAGTRKVKPIWILLKQETVSGSGISWAICKSAHHSRQITTPTPHHSVFYRPDALPATQPAVSIGTEGTCLLTYLITILTMRTVHFSVTLQSKCWMSASRIWLFVDNFGAWKMQFGSLKVLELCTLSLLRTLEYTKKSSL